MEIMPLCKVRDMKIPPSKLKSGPADPSKLLSPGMRVQQKGRASATMMVSKFVQDSGLEKDDVLLVVDLNPGLVPEWAQATWSIFAEHLNGNNMPNAAWIGFAEDEGAKKDVDGFIEDMILTEHWDTHPDAGPKEPQQQVEHIIKPALEIASWHDNGGVAIPNILEGKFGDPGLHVQWMEVTKKFTAKMQGLMKEAGVQTSATARGLPQNTSGVPNPSTMLSGPDFTVDPKPHEFVALELETIAEDGLPADDIFWTVRATRTYPKIVATKSLDIYLILDKTVNPDHLKLDPCELWGFNAGDWKTGTVEELQGSG